MTDEEEYDTKYVFGEDVEWFQGNDDWISCRLKDGTKFSIGGKVFFEMLGELNFFLKRHGKNWRATHFERLSD